MSPALIAAIDLTLGMQAGVSGQVTAQPVPHLEAGARLHASTDVYAGSPGWVRSGLDPKHNLHLSPALVGGLNTGDTRVSLAVLGAAGAEWFTFREEKAVAALEEPITYGASGLRPAGAMILDLRVRPVDVQLHVPLPLTGSLYVDRIHLGLGLTFGTGGSPGR